MRPARVARQKRGHGLVSAARLLLDVFHVIRPALARVDRRCAAGQYGGVGGEFWKLLVRGRARLVPGGEVGHCGVGFTRNIFTI